MNNNQDTDKFEKFKQDFLVWAGFINKEHHQHKDAIIILREKVERLERLEEIIDRRVDRLADKEFDRELKERETIVKTKRYTGDSSPPQ